MKDVQGIQRGKCNTCECEEYRSPSIPGQLRCEYCNHTPAEHVRIVELGACKQCGEDNCDKYVSDEPNSYTDCQYCGCSANQHEGSDACEFLTSQTFFSRADGDTHQNVRPCILSVGVWDDCFVLGSAKPNSGVSLHESKDTFL